MPTLENIQGASLVGGIPTGAVSQFGADLLKAFGTKQERDAADVEKQRQDDLQKEIGILTGGEPDAVDQGKQDALDQISQVNPALSGEFQQALERGDPEELAGIRTATEEGSTKAGKLLGLKSHNERLSALREDLQKGIADGSASQEDTARVIALSNMPEEQLNLELQKMQVIGNAVNTAIPKPEGLFSTPAKRAAFTRLTASNPTLAEQLRKNEATRQASVPKERIPSSAIGKARQDLEAGDITQAEFEQISAAPIGARGSFSKAPGVVIEQEGGGFAQAIPVLNERTGQIENKIVPIGGQPVSRLGETAGETTARKVREAGGKKTEEGKVKRIQLAVDSGVDAAQGAAILNRTIDLLDSVETGGFDQASLRAKQLFGVESANEAELSANLGKSVLSQLRTVFGPQFTENEGSRLERIEAGFGKSTAGNKRLLMQTLKLVQRAATRGIDAAVEAGDFRAASDIQDLMDFRLTDEPASPSGGVLPEGITEDDISETMRANNMTREQVLERLNGR